MSKGKYYQEYRKERRRIQSFLRRNRAKGYIFPDNILPDRPKRITPASIRRLKRITPEFLYKKASYVDSETGEILTGTEAVKRRRSESAKRAAKTRKQRKRNTDDEGIYDRIAISTWYSQLEVYADGKGYAMLLAWADEIIQSVGRKGFAETIRKGTEAGNLITWDVVYKAGETMKYIANMTEYVPDQGVWYKEKLLDKLQFTKEFAEWAETQEEW